MKLIIRSITKANIAKIKNIILITILYLFDMFNTLLVRCAFINGVSQVLQKYTDTRLLYPPIFKDTNSQPLRRCRSGIISSTNTINVIRNANNITSFLHINNTFSMSFS